MLKCIKKKIQDFIGRNIYKPLMPCPIRNKELGNLTMSDKEYKVKDTRSNNENGEDKSVSKEVPSPEMPASFPKKQFDLNKSGFQAFPKPEDQIPLYDKFIFEESPKFKTQLSALAVNEATAAVIANKQGSQNLREKIKNRVADYFIREVAESTLSHTNMTKNLMLKNNFEMSTGLTDSYLNKMFKDGEDITDDIFQDLGNTINESYSKWSQSMTFTGMTGLAKDKKARGVLEDRVKTWNFDFKLGLKEDDLKDDEKLIQSYFQGASRNKAYMDSKKLDLYTP
jgi:hypothetical protein